MIIFSHATTAGLDESCLTGGMGIENKDAEALPRLGRAYIFSSLG